MKKIVVVVLILIVMLNAVMIISSLNKTEDAEKGTGISKSAKVEIKHVNPLFFVSLVKL